MKKNRRRRAERPNLMWCCANCEKKMFCAIFNFSTCLIVFIFFILPLILNLNICVIQNTSLVLSHSFFSFTSTLFMNTFGCFSSSFLLFSLPSAFHFFICTKSYILLWNFHEIRNFWTVCCAVIMQCFWSKILTAANMHCHDLINLAIYMSNAISIVAYKMQQLLFLHNDELMAYSTNLIFIWRVFFNFWSMSWILIFVKKNGCCITRFKCYHNYFEFGRMGDNV